VNYAAKWTFQVIARKRATILKFSCYSSIARIIVKTIFQIYRFQFYDSSNINAPLICLLTDDKHFTRIGTKLVLLQTVSAISFNVTGLFRFSCCKKQRYLSRFLFISPISCLRQIKWRAFINEHDGQQEVFEALNGRNIILIFVK